MSIENFKKEFIKYGVDNGYIKKPKRPKKDNSKKGDIFLNCRCCGVLIRPDWYSKLDQRYCADCL
jgi:hypothetical protein